jgi:TIR domain
MARTRRASVSRANVFISHSSYDRVFVERVGGVLQRHAIASWYAPDRLLGGQEWHDEIGRALKRCDWFLVVLSENALKSKWVKRELTFALIDDRYNQRILAIVKNPGDYTPLSWTLPSIQQIDFSGDFDEACVDLLRVWGIVYQPD